MQSDQFNADAVVIGGGFFGATIALLLARRVDRVVILERGPELLTRASYANQARVHAGYHYPRSMMTALRSSMNFARFVSEYEDCIDGSFTKLYAIARDSKVAAAQFKKICHDIGAPLKVATKEYGRLFNMTLIEEIFEVREVAFDAARLRARFTSELAEAGVEIRFGTSVQRVASGDLGGIEVYLEAEPEQEPSDGRLNARHVFCCAYAQNNTILQNSGLPLLPLKNELAEVALLTPPEPLRDVGITIMDGPFFAVMPFPARGLHSIHHVRYSPHHQWHDVHRYRDAYAHLEGLVLRSNYPLMIKDAARYLPCLNEASYEDSLFEVKTVLMQNEVDDGRPILYRPNYGIDNFSVLLGAKIDNIYDVVGALQPTVASLTV